MQIVYWFFVITIIHLLARFLIFRKIAFLVLPGRQPKPTNAPSPKAPEEIASSPANTDKGGKNNKGGEGVTQRKPTPAAQTPVKTDPKKGLAQTQKLLWDFIFCDPF